jgi:hypothetical protein
MSIKHSYILSVFILSLVFAGHIWAESNSTDIYKLWLPDVAVPGPNQISFPDVITYVRLNHAVKNKSQFLHGASIVYYKDSFYASWANSPENENSDEESVRGKTSADGINWSDAFVIAPDLPGQARRSHGSFFVYDEELYIFTSKFAGSDKPLLNNKIYFDGLQTEAFKLDAVTSKWEYVKVVADDFWPLTEPKKMADGNWIIGGVNKNFQAVVGIIDKSDIYNWRTVQIPTPTGKHFSETAILVTGDDILAIMRNQSSDVAAVSQSSDCGKTWSQAQETNYPMAASKPYAGILSTGQRYLISNIDKSRNILVMAISRPDEKCLSKIFMIRSGVSREPIFTGWAKQSQWSYPYAFEKGRKLFIVYSVGKEDCELAIVPLNVLN